MVLFLSLIVSKVVQIFTRFLCNSCRRHIINIKHSNHIANVSKCQLDYASAKRLKLNPLKSCIIYIPSKGNRRKAATENIFLLGRKIRLSISQIAYRYHRRKHVRRGDFHFKVQSRVHAAEDENIEMHKHGVTQILNCKKKNKQKTKNKKGKLLLHQPSFLVVNFGQVSQKIFGKP